MIARLNACRQSDTITLEANREVIAVENLGDGARATCSDGTTFECTALIGADGLNFVVRNYVIRDGDPVCKEAVCEVDSVSQA